MPNKKLIRTLTLLFALTLPNLYCTDSAGQIITTVENSNAGFEDGLTNWQSTSTNLPGEVVRRNWRSAPNDSGEQALGDFFFKFNAPGSGGIRQIVDLSDLDASKDQIVVCHGCKSGSGIGLFGVDYFDLQGKLVGEFSQRLSACSGPSRGLGDSMVRHHVAATIPPTAESAQLWALNLGDGEMVIDELSLVSLGFPNQSNLVINGGFETGLESPLFEGTEYWTLRGNSIARFDDNLFGLAPSLIIGSSEGANMIYQHVDVSPGTAYEFSVEYVRGGSLGIAGVYFKNASGKIIDRKKMILDDVSIPEPNEDNPIASATVLAPTSATEAMVWVWVRKTPARYPASELSRLLVYDVSLAPRGRNPLKQPFASESIWNMPIGSNAEYVWANVQPSTRAGMTADEDIIILRPDAPLTSIYQNFTAWNSTQEGARCLIQGRNLGKYPIPSDYFRPQPEGTTENNCAAILSPDGRTIVQNQPFTRCYKRKFATSLYVYPSVDLYGLGIEGAHGGSGLSSIGGTIRLGELVPGGSIPHALKINLLSELNYSRSENEADGKPGFRWPARWSDVHSHLSYNGSNPALQMGSLLAIHKDVDLSSNELGLETEAAKILAKALQDYGGYTVDDTGWNVYAIATEHGPEGSVLEEFESEWGFKFHDLNKHTPWARDMDRIFSNLHVIDNNSPDSVGGGGTPRVPMAPQLIDPDSNR